MASILHIDFRKSSDNIIFLNFYFFFCLLYFLFWFFRNVFGLQTNIVFSLVTNFNKNTVVVVIQTDQPYQFHFRCFDRRSNARTPTERQAQIRCDLHDGNNRGRVYCVLNDLENSDLISSVIHTPLQQVSTSKRTDSIEKQLMGNLHSHHNESKEKSNPESHGGGVSARSSVFGSSSKPNSACLIKLFQVFKHYYYLPLPWKFMIIFSKVKCVFKTSLID